MLVQYVMALVLTAIILLGAAVFVARKGLPGSSAPLFVRFTLAIAWWSATEAIAITLRDVPTALWVWRLSYVGVILLPVFFFHFLVDSLNLQGVPRRCIPWNYGLGALFIAADATPWLIARVEPKFAFRNFVEPGPLYAPFFLWWMVLATFGLWMVWRAQRRARGVAKVGDEVACDLEFMFSLAD